MPYTSKCPRCKQGPSEYNGKCSYCGLGFMSEAEKVVKVDGKT